MNDLLEQFLIESRELAEQATDDLLALEQAPDDRARLDSAFREFHTLKGAAGIVGFAAMGRAVHAAEELLAAVRGGDYPLTADLITNCLACLDQIVRWLDAMETEGEPPADAELAASNLVAKFALPGGPPVTSAQTAPASGERPPWIAPMLAGVTDVAGARVAIRYVPDARCFFRGEDPLALMGRLTGLLSLNIQPRQPWPPLQEFDPFACNLIIDALSSDSPQQAAEQFKTVSDQVTIHALLERNPGEVLTLPGRAAEILQAQISLVSGPPAERSAARLTSAGRVAGNVLRHFGLRADATKVDAALARSLAAADPGPLITALDAILAAPADAVDHEVANGPEAAAPSPQAQIARTLHVDVERVDAIVNLTGELTVVKNAIGHATRLAQEGGDPAGLARVLKQQHALLDRLTADLQRSVLAIRVLPLRQVFRRFPPMVRDMARSLGKSVRLVSEGEDTEADKVVIEALFEPLLHVVRNAVDHGVEEAERRGSAGKRETAFIRLHGHREGEHVIIEVEDDGRGIDPAEVRRVAAEQGLATADALADLSDDEAVDLIFAPGLSTATAVTAISGRGVGMDAVRSAIERLGGRVTVRSRAGEGTTVRFSLPFTVMMTRVMTVEVAGQIVGVPFEAVVETLQLPRDRIVPIGATRAFVLRGRTVPLVDLARTLGLDPNDTTPPVANIVVVEFGGQWGALEVDRFEEWLDVMLKPMDGLLAGTAGVAGTTLLGEGRVLIVLDIEELLR
jgi:two-component system chemotaxis sensor kinase CheA